MKCVLYVDGSNLFGGLTELLGFGAHINFRPFLAEIKKDFQINETRFYGTYMKIDASKPVSYKAHIMAQKAFFDSAKNSPGVTFIKGHFSGSGKEKGVDVKLAVDMTVGAYKGDYDEAIIMTGDADLRYAVEVAKGFGKPVHMAAIGSRFPFGVSVIADRKVVYDYGHFFTKTIIPSYKRKPKDLVIKDLKGKLKVQKV